MQVVALTNKHSDETTEVLAELLRNPHLEPWVYTGQGQAIETIIRTALARGTPVTIQKAEEVVGYLASVGETTYLRLLD